MKFGVSVDGNTIFLAGRPTAHDAETLRRALFSPPLEEGAVGGTHRARVTAPPNPLPQGEGKHLVYLPLGQTNAATLAHLASLLAPHDSIPARADAATLQAAGFTNLHVSGCAKGCAYPRPATTLVGRNGRYDVIRHGRAGDRPDLTGLTLSQAMAAL